MTLVDFHYDMILKHYGSLCAKRSGVLYMKHIDQGLNILNHLNASEHAKAAYCVHPIFQVPDGLNKALETKLYERLDKRVILLVMEYRNKANSYLCRPRTDNFTIDDLPYMVLDEVKDMLIADKVQNYSDFLKYHKDTHERSKELDKYFNLWFEHLDVDYEALKDLL